MHTAEIVLGLLSLATAVAVFAERLRVPAPSLLVVAGLAVGLLPSIPEVRVTPELVSFVVLPPLLYAAAIDVVISDLKAVLRPVAVLAVGLVAASAVVLAVVVHFVSGSISLGLGLVPGAALASTDPVAVSALARRLHLPPRLLALVQGESLLNDATSLLLFTVVVDGVVQGHLAGPIAFPLRFLALGVGGAAIGVGCAYLVRLLHLRTDDPVIEAVIALITPYAVFTLATLAHTSGVTAVVFGGLYLGRRRYQYSRGPARLQTTNIYGVVVFLLESAVFAIIGLELPTLVRHLPAADRDFVLVALAVTGTLLVVRLVWVLGVTYLPGLLDHEDGTPTTRRRWSAATVISWAGTRGVVPLAAALSIPLTISNGAPFPHRDLLLVLITTCTVITLVVQGFTLRPLVQRAGLVDDPKLRTGEEALARHAALRAAVTKLEELEDLEMASPAAVEWLRREFADRLERAENLLRASPGAENGTSQPVRASRQEMQSLRRELLAAESARLHELVGEGRISEAIRRRVQRRLDLEEARAADE